MVGRAHPLRHVMVRFADPEHLLVLTEVAGATEGTFDYGPVPEAKSAPLWTLLVHPCSDARDF
jgi:hypothetical protein